ncbi:MAG: dockerin type I domain-containing protein [Opitutales bacterium]
MQPHLPRLTSTGFAGAFLRLFLICVCVLTGSTALAQRPAFDFRWGAGGDPDLQEWTDTEPGVNPVTGWFVDFIATTLFPSIPGDTALLPGGELDLDTNITIDGFAIAGNSTFNLRGRLTLTDFMTMDTGQIHFFNSSELRLTDANAFIANGGTFFGDDGVANIRGNVTNGFFESDPLSPPNPGFVIANGGDLRFSESGRTFLNTVAGLVQAVGNSRVSFVNQHVVLDGGDTTGDGTIEAIGNSTVVYRSGNILNPILLNSGVLDVGNASPAAGEIGRFVIDDAPGFGIDISGDVPSGVELSVVSGSTLDVPNLFENSGDITLAGPEGSLVITGFSTGGTFTNYGQFTFRQADINASNKHRVNKDLINAPDGNILVTDASNPRLNVVVNNGTFRVDPGTRVDSSTDFEQAGGNLIVDGDLFALSAGTFEWSGGAITSTTGIPTVSFTGFTNFPFQTIKIADGRDTPIRFVMAEPGGGGANLDDNELSVGQILEIQNETTSRSLRLNPSFVNRGTILTTGDNLVSFEMNGESTTNFGLMDFSGQPGSPQVTRRFGDLNQLVNNGQVVLQNTVLLLERFAGADYVQSADGELSIELRQTTAGGFDRIQASGGAELDGKLTLNVASGFAPSLYDVVSILQTNFAPNNDVSGDFACVDGVHLGTVGGFDASLAVTYRLDFVDVTVAKTGDLNLDTTVDSTDLLALGGGFNAPGTWATGDVNGDGFVDEDDLDRIAANVSTGPISRAQAAALAGITAEPRLIFEIQFVDLTGQRLFEVTMDAGREGTLGDALFTDDLNATFRPFSVFGGTKTTGMLGAEPVVHYRFPLSSNDQLFARPPQPVAP